MNGTEKKSTKKKSAEEAMAAINEARLSAEAALAAINVLAATPESAEARLAAGSAKTRRGYPRGCAKRYFSMAKSKQP